MGDRRIGLRGVGTHRVAAGGTLGHVRVGDDLASQDHVRAVPDIGIRIGEVEVAEQVDVAVRHDLAVLVGRHVVAYSQRHVPGLGEHGADRHHAWCIDVVAARGPGVALGEPGVAVFDQEQVLVEVARIAHGDPDVPVDGVGEEQAEIGIDLGEVDVLGRLERHVIVGGRQPGVGGGQRRVGATRVGGVHARSVRAAR